MSEQVQKRLKEKGYNVVHPKSFLGYYYSLICGYVFITNYWADIGNPLAFAAKQILLYHGQAIKKIGYANTMGNKEEKETFLMKIQHYFSLSTLSKTYATLSTAPFFNNFIMQSWHVREECIWQTGLPRCDILFSNKKERFVLNIRDKYKDCKVLLYMPTFRMEDFGTGEEYSPFKKEYGYNKFQLMSFLEEQNIVILYKPHVVDGNLILPDISERLIQVFENDFDDLYVLLNSVDALITDYSSVYIDFLSTGKQIYLFTFDYDEYIQKSRDVFFDIRENFHGIFCNNWQDFYVNFPDTIYHNINQKDISKFACNNDGKSCENICKLIAEKES